MVNGDKVKTSQGLKAVVECQVKADEEVLKSSLAKAFSFALNS